MEANLIDLNHYAVKATLKTLLQDKTTKKNIIWATTSYADKGPEYQVSSLNYNVHIETKPCI